MMMAKVIHDKKEMGKSSSGSGGYRPTIDWHELTIRQKNTADRQVLACIVLSGVLIIVLGVVLTVLGFFVFKTQCPLEWVEGPGSCFYLTQNNASWMDSKGYCEGQGGALLDLHSQQEADFVLERMEGPSWLGLMRAKRAWVWSSGRAVNYTAWEDPAAADAATSQCAVMMADGLWSVVPCQDTATAYVICEYQPGYNPFVLIGPVVIVCGVVVLMLSIEVCIRRREFMEKNPEIMDDDQENHQVNPGLVNYGFGNYPSETVKETPLKTVSWDPADKGTKVTPGSSAVLVKPLSDSAATYSPGAKGQGPRVHIVPASLPASPNLAVINGEENSQSQENLELLLSPKTLE